ncbi:uncharacterized protein LOC142342239 [Convolutriloba macropyga]|uniref:uncharacterized protein LOC142342239 n=1 Tax=Convolutriloba macropyga TaxID=536237 RepID=UPI003F527CB0
MELSFSNCVFAAVTILITIARTPTSFVNALAISTLLDQCSWDYWDAPSGAKTRTEYYEELIKEQNIEIAEQCSDAISSGCTTKEIELNNANACVNCPIVQTVCSCEKCTVYGANCEERHGVCKPRIIDYHIITLCQTSECAKEQLQHYTPIPLSVGCYCDTQQGKETEDADLNN